MNILFLMTDQHRWDAMSCSGDWVKTPNMDRIKARGVQFTQCITTTPVCVPARLTLATGKYPHNNGVWTHQTNTMPVDVDNWMREIRNLGYRTSLFGKTHLHPHVGDLREKEDLMHAWGLDDVNEIGGPRACTQILSHMTEMWDDKGLLEDYRADVKARFSNKPYVVRPSTLPLEDFYDVYVGQQAKQYLKTYNRDEPWFCWVSFGGPHEPWDTPEPYASMYDPNTMPEAAADGVDDAPRPRGFADHLRQGRLSPAFEHGEINAMRANYAGNVTLIDDQIGEIFDVIEARGEMDNTIMAFTSDHGEMNGDHGLIYKMNFYDGSLRVPLIVSVPGGKSDFVSDSLVENSDIGPTLVELAGGSLDYLQFAKSFTGALDGGEHREDGLSEIEGEFMLMNNDWKIALNREGLTYLLFDRKNDPKETRNLAGLAEYKSTADALRLRILERILQSQDKATQT
ncbi:MAG: sulfatase-like hydrolase/transferase [Pseudomonadales bacterium]|nr:sulfatase-like hydrolase/transferase [Pseudomonadales bacterium]